MALCSGLDHPRYHHPCMDLVLDQSEQKLLIPAALYWIMGAGFFKAVSDTLSHHYETSIFSRLNPKWWNPNESWKHVKFLPFTRYRPDAWHISNSLMILCFCIAAFGFTLWTIIAGVAFILVFNTNYNIILKRKNPTH